MIESHFSHVLVLPAISFREIFVRWAIIRPLAWLLPGHAFPYVFRGLSFKSSNALLFVGVSSHQFLYLLQVLIIALRTLEL